METRWRRADGRIERAFCQQRGVQARGSSAPLQRAMVDFGADEAFAGAAAKVREHYGVEVAVSRHGGAGAHSRAARAGGDRG